MSEIEAGAAGSAFEFTMNRAEGEKDKEESREDIGWRYGIFEGKEF